MENLKLLSYADLQQLGYGSQSTIFRRVRAGTFPAPLKMTGGQVAWRESAIADYLKKIAAPPKATDEVE